MSGARERWANRLRRLARSVVWERLGTSMGASFWFIPPPPPELMAKEAQVADDEPLPGFDARDLDAWLAQVLRDADKRD